MPNGAERLFGYTADEVIGRPVTMLFPADRHNEEPDILARIRRGERVPRGLVSTPRIDGEAVAWVLTLPAAAVRPIAMAANPDTTLYQVGALPVRRDEKGSLNVLLVTTRETRRWSIQKVGR